MAVPAWLAPQGPGALPLSIVALEDGADLTERVAPTEDDASQAELRTEAEQFRRNADVIRKLVEGRTAPSTE